MGADVAPEFIDNAFEDTSPVSTLQKLGWAWSLRSDSSAPRFGLTKTEYAVQLIRIYSGEVGNGGHAQYLFNRGLDHFSDTADALESVGLTELATIHAAALKAVGIAAPAASLPEVRSVIETLSWWRRRKLTDLDRRFFQGLSGLDAILVDHLRRNRADLLPAPVDAPD